MWRYVADRIDRECKGGMCLEFGVAGGVSINALSGWLPNFEFYGFDSFVGLAEDWIGHHATKGAYDQGGVLPSVNSNVSLVSGWFETTVPQFVDRNDLSKLRLLHIDSDTYEAATTVFDCLHDHIRSGILVLFDELIGYPNWKNGEYRALCEASAKYGFQYKFLAFSSEQALIEIV